MSAISTKRGASIDECCTIDPVSGCKIWQRGKNNRGYGSLQRQGKKYLVHRWVWIQANGPISDGTQVDHVADRGCISRACCNLEHMELVTNAENSRRGKRAKLTSSRVMFIRILLRNGVAVKKIAAMFDVQTDAIYRIRNGKRWV